MAINWTEMFEDYGQEILAMATFKLWRENASPDLDELFQEGVVLFGEATAFQAPEHGFLVGQFSTDYTTNRGGLDQAIGRSFTTARDKILKGTMLSYMRVEGTAPITGTSTPQVLLALRDNMQSASQTIDANVVGVGTVTYDVADNQGDIDNADAWAAIVEVDTTGTHHQLIRPAVCIMECDLAGYANQGAERFKLYGIFTDTDEDFDSPIDYFMGDHTDGVETEDVSLNAQGEQTPGSGRAVYTGIVVTLKGIDINNISESGDGVALGVSAYAVDLHTADKTPFRRENTTYAGVAGARNGTVYLLCDFDGTQTYAFTLYKDAGQLIPLSQVVTHDCTLPDATKTLVVASSAEDLFDGLVAGDEIMSFLVDSSALLAFAADYTITLGVPLPIAVGDIAQFTLTSDQGGTFQTHFVQRYNFYLPSATGGAETIADTLAE